MRSDIRYVQPGLLRVSPMRPEGADPMKLQDQFNEFGFSTEDMPPIEVALGMGREMMINNGMTRAIRCCMINSEQAIPIEVIEIRSEWGLSRLPTIAETMTPASSGRQKRSRCAVASDCSARIPKNAMPTSLG